MYMYKRFSVPLPEMQKGRWNRNIECMSLYRNSEVHIMLRELRIGDMVAKLPIIQGGMGVGVSLSRLAGAVAREGGVGVISTAQIGFEEPEFEKDQAKANLIAIKKHIKKAKELACGHGMVGVNIMVALKHYKEHVLAAVEAGADVILMPAVNTVPGLSEQEVTEACRYIKAHGALSLSAIGTSQEGADEGTIREIALLNKRCGIDIQHIGDAGFCGIALPENIMALSIAIRGKRHTYHKIASSINR